MTRPSISHYLVSGIVLLSCLLFPVHGLPSDRVALVIGNADYDKSPLYNPLNDAKAVTERLEAFDFKVVQALDADLATMQQAVLDFVKSIRPSSTALVFYAGHGIQANGRNYLLPIDAEISSERALRFEALELNDILEELEESGARINIVILDACRNNPFERRFRGGSRGLAVVDAAQGTLIAYATAPGSVASDGDGSNGLYTQEFLKALEQPGLKVEEVFKEVRKGVSFASGGEQVPWESSSLTGDFVFNNAPVQVVTAPAPATHTQDTEAIFWRSIENSATAEDFEEYLDKYPQGTFAGIATRRLEKLTATQPSDCRDLTGTWFAWLQGDDNPACRDTFNIEKTDGETYNINYAMCGAMDTVTNIRGTGTLEGTTLDFKWKSTPCSGTTRYNLDQTCSEGSGRVIKRGGLPGVCSLFVNKNIVVDVARETVLQRRDD